MPARHRSTRSGNRASLRTDAIIHDSVGLLRPCGTERIGVAATRDQIGRRGERLFEVLITQFVSPKGPLFEPVFLGEKFPAVDYMVQLYNTEGVTAFCFVQVRATMQGTVEERNLPISLSFEGVQRLRSYPAPTYLVGIDVAAWTGYIVAVTDTVAQGIPSVAKTFALDETNLHHLWDEVDAYWREHRHSFTTSFFTLTERDER